MLRIITTRDVGPYAFDDVIFTFPPLDWEPAQRKLASLRSTYGPFFKLLAD
jgi:hypothetical protein